MINTLKVSLSTHSGQTVVYQTSKLEVKNDVISIHYRGANCDMVDEVPFNDVLEFKVEGCRFENRDTNGSFE